VKPSQSIFDLLKEDHARRWSRPLSWWHLLALLPYPFVVAFGIYAQQADLQIAKRQQTTVATINSHDPPNHNRSPNHNRYGYMFSINGHQFTGWAYPSDKKKFSIDERVLVYYDPSNPANNSTSDFHAVSAGDLFFVPFCVLATIALPLIIFFQHRARLNPPRNSLADQ
jgi:hypothetical protein